MRPCQRLNRPNSGPKATRSSKFQMLTLVGIIAALMAGKAIGVVLAGLTLPAWAALAGELVSGGSSVAQSIGSLHPVLKDLVADIKAGHPPQVAAQRASAAALLHIEQTMTVSMLNAGVQALAQNRMGKDEITVQRIYTAIVLAQHK
jgi:hypothetical protein